MPMKKLIAPMPGLMDMGAYACGEIPDIAAGMDGWTLEVSAGDSIFVFE